ncbi:Dehydrogenase/reductase SDR family member 1, partial [Caligus rogercresseyi]
MSLRGKVAVVTGAWAEPGHGVHYGRSANELNRTANDIKERGGNAIPVSLDHNNDAAADQKGILDVLVNNAYSGALKCGIKSTGSDFETITWHGICIK